jgi:hypothetical protein
MFVALNEMKIGKAPSGRHVLKMNKSFQSEKHFAPLGLGLKWCNGLLQILNPSRAVPIMLILLGSLTTSSFAQNFSSNFNARHDSATQVLFPLDTFQFRNINRHLSLPAVDIHGFFCKMESRIEKTSGFSPRFRLGSSHYTDWMEGKKPIYMRYWR